MGHWEKERGEFVIPSKRWAATKKTIRDAHNGRQDVRFEAAKGLWKALRQGAKDGVVSMDEAAAYRWMGRALGKPENDDEVVVLVWRVYPGAGRGSRERGRLRDLKKPTRSMFPLATTKTTSLYDTCCTVVFQDATRTLVWNVEDNKNTVETARASTLGKVVFRTLRAMEWTRDTGGIVEYMNEYDAEAYSGGHETDGFGPRGEGVGVPRGSSRDYVVRGFNY